MVCISDSEEIGRLQLTKSSSGSVRLQGLVVNDRAMLSPYLKQELRSDHAGETGAVYIYKGIKTIARLVNDRELVSFAENHGATESEHLELMETVLAKNLQSRLLLLWRIAGWLIGAIPALFGRRAVYATIAAVETFVEQHYQAQIDHLLLNRSHQGLLQLLQRCQARMSQILCKRSGCEVVGIHSSNWMVNRAITALQSRNGVEHFLTMLAKVR